MKHLLEYLLIGILLAGCTASVSKEQTTRITDPKIVIGRTWQWVSTLTPAEKITVGDPGRYTVLLDENGRAQIRFDCNRGGGDYKIAEGQLSFGRMMSTRMACPQDSQDTFFVRDLQRVAFFFVQNGSLFLEMPYNSGTMRFRSPPDMVELRGTVVKKNLEGGFFAIDGDDGKTYEPINLPNAFRQNGMQVKATVRIRNDAGSIHSVGPIIEIVNIAKQ